MTNNNTVPPSPFVRFYHSVIQTTPASEDPSELSHEKKIAITRIVVSILLTLVPILVTISMDIGIVAASVSIGTVSLVTIPLITLSIIHVYRLTKKHA